eukprot:gene5779-11677_t
MGNSTFSVRQANVQVLDSKSYFQVDLPKFIHQSRLGTGKFIKSHQMRVDGINCVVKVYMKMPNEDLSHVIFDLSRLKKALSGYPNLLPYQIWVKSNLRTAKSTLVPAYLIRQYFMTNLYDRLSTRPFLKAVEKEWLLYQLMRCLEDCHREGIVHGDVRPENCLVTSWNWVVLSDFASFKPTFLPDDDPNDFQYYFDAMNRHRCYLAPERFYSRGVEPSRDRDIGNESEGGTGGLSSPSPDPLHELLERDPSLAVSMLRSQYPTTDNYQEIGIGTGTGTGVRFRLTEAMDIFSLGCTAAEILLDGEPLLDLPGMLRYRHETGGSGSGSEKGFEFSSLDEEVSPARSTLMKIQDVKMREAIIAMTKRSVEERVRSVKSQRLWLEQQQVFPEYFSSVLYKFFQRIHSNGITPDDRIAILSEDYGSLLESMGGDNVEDSEGSKFFKQAMVMASPGSTDTEDGTAVGAVDVDGENESQHIHHLHLGEDGREGGGGAGRREGLETLLDRCEKLIGLLEGKKQSNDARQQEQPEPGREREMGCDDQFASKQQRNEFVNAANFSDRQRPVVPGVLLLIQIVCSVLKHLRHPRSRIIALVMLLRLGLYTADEDLLQRVVPNVMAMLEDPVACVRATAMKCLRALLAPVQAISALESDFFSQYIFPALSRISKDPEVVVRIAFAESLGLLAEVSRRFLEHSHHLKLSRALTAQSNRAILAINDTTSNTTSAAKDAIEEEVLIAHSPTSSIQNRSDTTSSRHARSMSSVRTTTAPGQNNNNSNDVGDVVVVSSDYDKLLHSLHDNVSRWIRDLTVTENNPSGSSVKGKAGSQQQQHHSNAMANATSLVKRLLLADISRLCCFFGYLNIIVQLTDLYSFPPIRQDWELRQAFCSQVPALCVFVGPAVTALCVLPCLSTAIADVEEAVVAAAIHCLQALVQLDLLSPQLVQDSIRETAPLLIHPSVAVRHATTQLIEAAARVLGQTDTYVLVLPLLKASLRMDLVGVPIVAANIELVALPPLSREAFRWALANHSQYLHSAIYSSPQKSSPLVPIDNDTGKSFGKIDAGVAGVRPSITDISDADNTQQQPHHNESSQLEVMSPYLVQAARELDRNIRLHGTGTGLGKDATGHRPLHSSMTQMAPTQGLSEHLAHSLFVPHQKYIQLFSCSPELWRRAISLVNLPETNGNAMDDSDASDFLQAMFGHESALSSVEAAALRASSSADISGGSDLSNELPAKLLYKAGPPTIIGSAVVIPVGESPSTKSKGRTPSQSPRGQTWTTHHSHGNGESYQLLNRFRALEVPPLSLDLGVLRHPDGRQFSIHNENVDFSGAIDGMLAHSGRNSSSSWRPRDSALVATLLEHTHSVNCISVAGDQSYFASASSDKTAKIWQLSGLDKAAFPRSSMTYTGHEGKVMDIVAIENSHSMASCSDDGSIHVWRVDLGGSGSGSGNPSAAATSKASGLSVRGMAVVRTMTADDGAVVNIAHFNGDVSSIIVYCTLSGRIQGWDLRSDMEAFQFSLRPELGYPTTICLSAERLWVAIGTSLGFIAIWDIRFQVICKLWQHSSRQPIHRLICLSSSSSSSKGPPNGFDIPGTYFVVAAGSSEAAVWRWSEGGDCVKCVRAMPMSQANKKQLDLPVLKEIPLPAHPRTRFHCSLPSNPAPSVQSAFKAVLGRMSSNGSVVNIITGGTDRHIRYWDFHSPVKCFTVSGLDAGQPRPSFEAPVCGDKDDFQGRLLVCYDADVPNADVILQTHRPLREGRGPVPPTGGFKDEILDLKSVELPMRMIISSSRDGQIKLWREGTRPIYPFIRGAEL